MVQTIPREAGRYGGWGAYLCVCSANVRELCARRRDEGETLWRGVVRADGPDGVLAFWFGSRSGRLGLTQA